MADNRILIGKATELTGIYPKMSNRHGLIAGATGTGKTVTLQKMAEGFSKIGVPVFLSDIKGDLSGIAGIGTPKDFITKRLDELKITDFSHQSFPAAFWDIYGELGTPLRTTITEMGPMILSQVLGLNDTQSGVLSVIFRIADEKNLALLDIKDLKSILKYASDNSDQISAEYGMVSKVSISAIQRELLKLEDQNAGTFFGEPAIDILDFIQTAPDGKGVINILSCEKLYHNPGLYSLFMLWLISELFENLPEAGDSDKPKIVFFFDEAHLLFSRCTKEVTEKIEQTVRLIRSKGVGIYFVTQSPSDIPDEILGQLGNRVQHALRAFTPKDLKAVKTAALTFRQNPSFDTAAIISELGVGEALVSFLDEKGVPSIVEKVFIIPAESRIGPVEPDRRRAVINNSKFHNKYNETIDRESAYEILAKSINKTPAPVNTPSNDTRRNSRSEPARSNSSNRRNTTSERVVKGVVRDVAKSIGGSIGRSIGGQTGGRIVRGILGNLFRN